MLTALSSIPPATARPHAAAETRPVCRQRRYNHWADEIYYEGPWEVGPLRDALTGHISKDADQCACTFTFEGCGLILQFWSHPWSGVAEIEVDGVGRSIDLFADSPTMRNIHIDGLPPGMHLARIRGAKRQDGKHAGDQIVFHEAIVYDRLTEVVVTPPGQTPATNKPARFNAIYYAPGPLGWAERAVLYSTVFGDRPTNVLLAGTGTGGAAVIVAAALDDLGVGALTCVDPDPDISPELWLKMGHRTAVVVGTGPAALAEARTRAEGQFDFAFVEAAAVAYWTDVVAALSDDAILLLHTTDNRSPKTHPCMVDGGVLVPASENTGGIRLLRRGRSA